MYVPMQMQTFRLLTGRFVAESDSFALKLQFRIMEYRVEHLEPRTLPHEVVITFDQDYPTVQVFQVGLGAAEGEVPQMKHGVSAPDYIVPLVDETAVHGPDVGPRALTVVDDLPVPEVGVGCDKDAGLTGLE
jgi:hypothetical protein